MKFFTKKASRALRTKRGWEDWQSRWDRYEKHLERIRSRLSKGWRKVAETDFHDTAIFSFGIPKTGEYIVNVDMGPRWKEPPFRICSLHFYGVRKVQMPKRARLDWLIYSEVHIPKTGGGELRALLAKHTELRIVAHDVDFTLNYRAGDW